MDAEVMTRAYAFIWAYLQKSDNRQQEDWRLQGQKEDLHRVKLYWRRYTRYSPTWDHDHCRFCWAKFMVEDYPDVLHDGYSTEDQYHWVCATCFEDFKEKFQWDVANSAHEDTKNLS
jgi:hypothetical protein